MKKIFFFRRTLPTLTLLPNLLFRSPKPMINTLPHSNPTPLDLYRVGTRNSRSWLTPPQSPIISSIRLSQYCVETRLCTQLKGSWWVKEPLDKKDVLVDTRNYWDREIYRNQSGLTSGPVSIRVTLEKGPKNFTQNLSVKNKSPSSLFSYILTVVRLRRYTFFFQTLLSYFDSISFETQRPQSRRTHVDVGIGRTPNGPGPFTRVSTLRQDGRQGQITQTPSRLEMTRTVQQRDFQTLTSNLYGTVTDVR